MHQHKVSTRHHSCICTRQAVAATHTAPSPCPPLPPPPQSRQRHRCGVVAVVVVLGRGVAWRHTDLWAQLPHHGHSPPPQRAPTLLAHIPTSPPQSRAAPTPTIPTTAAPPPQPQARIPASVARHLLPGALRGQGAVEPSPPVHELTPTASGLDLDGAHVGAVVLNLQGLDFFVYRSNWSWDARWAEVLGRRAEADVRWMWCGPVSTCTHAYQVRQ